MREIVHGITPSQTVGPFFAYGLTSNGKYDWNDAFTNNLVTSDTSGERIRIEGRVFDGDGQPVPDCMLEIWQADAQGRFSDPKDKRALPNSAFRGFGRCGSDANGGYAAPIFFEDDIARLAAGSEDVLITLTKDAYKIVARLPVPCPHASLMSSSAFFRLAAAKTTRGLLSAQLVAAVLPATAIATAMHRIPFRYIYRDIGQFIASAKAA